MKEYATFSLSHIIKYKRKTGIESKIKNIKITSISHKNKLSMHIDTYG